MTRPTGASAPAPKPRSRSAAKPVADPSTRATTAPKAAAGPTGTAKSTTKAGTPTARVTKPATASTGTAKAGATKAGATKAGATKAGATKAGAASTGTAKTGTTKASPARVGLAKASRMGPKVDKAEQQFRSAGTARTPVQRRPRVSTPVAPAATAPLRVRLTSVPSLPLSETTRTAEAHRAAGSVSTRAAVGVGLLLGYYVLGVLVIAAVIGLNVLVYDLGYYDGRLILLTVVVIAAVAIGVFKPQKRLKLSTVGIALTPAEQPRLWTLVREVAAAAGTKPPSDIVLSDDVNAAVTERTHALGLIPGRRSLLLGMGLMSTLDVSALRAVLAHEMGHHVGGDTRLGPLNARAGAAIHATGDILDGNVFGLPFQAYGKMYRKVSLSVRRSQELSADRLAAQVAGTGVMIDALREVHAAGELYVEFRGRFLMPLWRSGVTPGEPFSGFRAVLASPRSADRLHALRLEDARPTDPFDSHPSLRARVGALSGRPIEGSAGFDERSSLELLEQPAAVEARLAAWMAGTVLKDKVAQVVTWDDAGTRLAGVRAAELDRVTISLVQQVGAALTLEDLVARCAEEGADPQLVELTRFALCRQLVEAGAARWTTDFDELVVAVDVNGLPVVLPALDRTTAARALAKRGIDLGVTLREATPPRVGPRNVLVNTAFKAKGKRTFKPADLLVFDDCGVFSRRRAGLKEMRSRITSQYGRGKGARALAGRRLEAYASLSAADALALNPGNHLVTWGEVQSIALKKGGNGSLWTAKVVAADGSCKVNCAFFGQNLQSARAILGSVCPGRVS